MLTEDMRNIVDNARKAGWILEPDAKRLLSLAGLMVPDFTLAATAQDAAERPAEMTLLQPGRGEHVGHYRLDRI